MPSVEIINLFKRQNEEEALEKRSASEIRTMEQSCSIEEGNGGANQICLFPTPSPHNGVYTPPTANNLQLKGLPRTRIIGGNSLLDEISAAASSINNYGSSPVANSTNLRLFL